MTHHLPVSIYFWFDPESLEFVGLRIVGNRYQEIPNQPQGKWSDALELYLGILDGQLRFFKPNGELVPTPQESAVREGEAALFARNESALAKQEAALAKEESASAKQETALAKQDVEQLKAKLRELGIEP